MTKPRIGLVAYWKGYDRKTYLKAAQLADELGYESFWVPEAWGYDAVPLITEMALHTKRIKLCTGILNVFSRSPGLLAMTAATLHEISEGRFVLGIGTSGARVIEGFHGRPFDKPLTQTRDVLKVVRGLLRGESLDRVGAELARYRPFTLATKNGPYHVPIYVAALKQKAIESVGELADGWMPAFWPFHELGRGLAWLEQGAARAGRSVRDIDVAPVTAAIPLGKRGMDMAKDIIAFYVGGMGDFYREMLSSLGFAEACDRIAALYANKETRARAKDAVPDDMINAMTVSGDPLGCHKRLAELSQYGVTQPLLGLPPGGSWPAIAAYLHVMAPSRTPTLVQLMATGAVRSLSAIEQVVGKRT
jgi:alkanesulfonate monooxygenase SsuD/methylene tetrahydromethanopterin reductase-like flavin-dependent oxidoreductase (luciferase family)